jgi:hypothetical protein
MDDLSQRCAMKAISSSNSRVNRARTSLDQGTLSTWQPHLRQSA